MRIIEAPRPEIVADNVRVALAEDIGSGDITARLVPSDALGRARVISRQSAVICGRPWVDEVFAQVDTRVRINWQCVEGDLVEPEQILFSLEGPSRALLTGERCALNFLQLLSGTATSMCGIRKISREHWSAPARYPQNHSGAASRTEIRGALRRL